MNNVNTKETLYTTEKLLATRVFTGSGGPTTPGSDETMYDAAFPPQSTAFMLGLPAVPVFSVVSVSLYIRYNIDQTSHGWYILLSSFLSFSLYYYCSCERSKKTRPTWGALGIMFIHMAAVGCRRTNCRRTNREKEVRM